MTLEEIVHSYFRQATEDFLNDPGGDQWLKLRMTMWAVQGVKQMSVPEQSFALRGLILGIARTHKGDTNFEEPQE